MEATNYKFLSDALIECNILDFLDRSTARFETDWSSLRVTAWRVELKRVPGFGLGPLGVRLMLSS
jgi:hypothetical protein